MAKAVAEKVKKNADKIKGKRPRQQESDDELEKRKTNKQTPLDVLLSLINSRRLS